jgi:hypothetical protein
MGDDMVSSDPPAGMPPRALRDRVSSAGKGARVHALKASDALVETVGGLADRAIDRVLLTGEPVTSAADGKLLLARQADTEAFADDIQRIVVLAVPVVRTLARGARFTKVPWVMVASSAVSIGVAVRTGVRELQVLSSLVAHRLEQAEGVPRDAALVKKLAIDLYLAPKRTPRLADSLASGCSAEPSAGRHRSGPRGHSTPPSDLTQPRSLHAGKRCVGAEEGRPGTNPEATVRLASDQGYPSVQLGRCPDTLS